MKLIDLLVQELPKRGGWPKGVDAVEQDSEGQLFEMDSDYCSDFKLKKCDDWIADVVTKQQYESAISASQKPAWNGEGLPPVGCECEYLDNNGKWYPVTIKYASDQLVVISGVTKILGVEQGTEIAKDIIIDKPQFRPLQSEAERKHEAVLESICAVLEMVAQDYKREDEAKLIYEAIAAGKIPGVKLED
ncbi:hypothetical protein KGB42_gp64 [Salmonella phage Seszw_1]|uniref:Uncharacterized protein n=1 Tax=Salmonella phage Seszw_1 TaxID=2479482 RepID=A0A411BFE5_9CAUD|nr:hypothetical protein KGB42_gp64 [Salmonella phage Seszw_1]QZB85784.1 hypothetical protein seszw10L_70 [Salmonella phage seszw]QAY00274.1 hypothetical protein Seszw_64 [Salmonella phage Seszw_1]QZB85865.1 hypothetical protein seszw10S_70 [Salmonella phage seszw]QZB85944.1 hypothetical protein seszw20L_70 [Salmonella phage seszw]QZB86024.1 hypothetical protein seszw20S_70 [Salmonella phage seszw]